jgi:hypothetical protein
LFVVNYSMKLEYTIGSQKRNTHDITLPNIFI